VKAQQPQFADRYCGKFDGDVVLMCSTNGAPITNIPNEALDAKPDRLRVGIQQQGLCQFGTRFYCNMPHGCCYFLAQYSKKIFWKKAQKKVQKNRRQAYQAAN